MEEEDPESDIEVGDEAVYLEGDEYLLEDDEDKILEGEKEQFSDDEVKVPPVITTKPPKVLKKILPDRVNATWDLTKVRNICTSEDGSFVIPQVWEKSFPIMARKGGPGFYHDGYIFSCRDEDKDTPLHHYECDGKGCHMKVIAEGFTKFKETGVERDRKNPKKKAKTEEKHTCELPNDLIKRMFRWHLRKCISDDPHLNRTNLIEKKVAGKTNLQKNEMWTLKANWDYLTNLISTKKSMGSKSASLITLTITPPCNLP